MSTKYKSIVSSLFVNNVLGTLGRVLSDQHSITTDTLKVFAFCFEKRSLIPQAFTIHV